ncbi:MAG: hypothetical protein ACRDMJ_11665, partial [Solirubrobacteraceae bacterium]
TDIDAATTLRGVACASTTSGCTAVDNSGNALSLMPPFSANLSSSALVGIACPGSLCTAISGSRELTFYGSVPSAIRSASAIDLPGDGDLTALSCPSPDECTAVDQGGYESTFDPMSPPVTPAPASIDSHPLQAVSCPGSDECAATDDDGSEVTFDPAAPSDVIPETIDPGRTLAGIACPSLAQCVAVDQAGDVVVGGPVPEIVSPPELSVSQPVPGGAPLPYGVEAAPGDTLTATTGVWTGDPTAFAYQWQRCAGVPPSGSNCVSIQGATSASYAVTIADVPDQLRVLVTATGAGGISAAAASAGTQGVAPPPPVLTAPPQVSGTPRVGARLTTSTGLWTAVQPLSYTYMWQLCASRASSSCGSASVATEASFVLPASAWHRRVRVIVTASDPAGSMAAPSSPIGPVGASVSEVGRALTSAARMLAGARGRGSATLPALGAGTLTVVWSVRLRHRAAVVARTAERMTAMAGRRISLKLNRIGRQLLHARRSLRVTERLRFSWTGHAVTRTRRFTLRTITR